MLCLLVIIEHTDFFLMFVSVQSQKNTQPAFKDNVLMRDGTMIDIIAYQDEKQSE